MYFVGNLFYEVRPLWGQPIIEFKRKFLKKFVAQIGQPPKTSRNMVFKKIPAVRLMSVSRITRDGYHAELVLVSMSL